MNENDFINDQTIFNQSGLEIDTGITSNNDGSLLGYKLSNYVSFDQN